MSLAPPSPSRSRAQALLLIAAAGCLLRLAFMMAAEAYREPFAFEHGEIASNLVAGRGFTVRFLGHEGPTSQQAPLYPAIVACFYYAWGDATPGAFLGLFALQAIVGGLACAAAASAAWSLAPTRPALGWIAGAIAALHPAHVYMASQVQVAVWATALLAAIMALLATPSCRGRWLRSLGAGLLLGALLLFEPILALAAPLLAWLLWRDERSLPPASIGGYVERQASGRAIRAGGHVALLTLGALLVTAPWIVRNYRVHGQWSFVKTTFGYAFWQGNNPHSWGTDKIPKPSAEELRTTHDGSLRGISKALQEARSETLYIDDVLLKPHGYDRFAGLSEPERSQQLGREAWAFIRRSPDRYARLCLTRLRYFLLFDETNPKAAHPAYRAITLAWLALTAAGAFALRGHARRLWPLAAMFAVVTAFHAATIVSGRFRLPVEPLTWLWTAAGLAWLASYLPTPVWNRLPLLRSPKIAADVDAG